MKLAERLLLILLAGVAGAGEAPSASAPATRGVELVEVDAVVVDPSGTRLTDLTREEFELEVDGRPVPIASFAAPHSAPPATASAEKPGPADLLIFVDQSNLDWKASKRIFDEIRRFARDRAANKTRILIAAYAQDLRIFSPPTADLERIERAFSEINALREKNSSDAAERTRLLQEVRTYGRVRLSPVTPGAPEELVELRANREGRVQVQELERLRTEVQNFGERELDRQTRAIAALRAWIGGLGAIEGRKSLLVATSGYTAQPTAFLEQLLNPAIERTLRERNQGFPVLEGAELRMMDEIDRTVRQAQDGRVVLFTLSPAHAPATQATSELETPGATFTGIAPPREVAFAETGLSLSRLAESTGGATLRFDESLQDRLDAAREDAESTYWLGFEAPADSASSAASGNLEHRIVVRMKRPRLEVRHRPSYRLRTVEERAEAALSAAVAHDATANDLGLILELGPAVALEKRGAERRVPVLVRVPLGPLAFTPAGTTREGRLSARVAVRDESGRIRLGSSDPIRISIPEADLERALGSYWAYRAEVELSPGTHLVAVVVADEIGSRLSTATGTVAIPPK